MTGQVFMNRIDQRTLRIAALCVLLLAAACSNGCMRRRMNIISDPPGAVVTIDGYPIGTTPCSTEFTYYGQRSIRLVKDGFETLEVLQPVNGPWYQAPPIDFVTDNVWPGQINDERTFKYVLTPRAVEDPQLLRARAEALRNRSHAAAGVPIVMPASTPPGMIPPGSIQVAPPAGVPNGPVPPGPMLNAPATGARPQSGIGGTALHALPPRS